MLTTILVPTDGSDHANRAVSLAADLATKYGVVLLHVLLQGEQAVEFGHMAEVEHLLEAEGAVAPAPAFGSLAPGTGSDRAHSAGMLERIGSQILGAAERSLRRKQQYGKQGGDSQEIGEFAHAESVTCIAADQDAKHRRSEANRCQQQRKWKANVIRLRS